MKDVLRECNLKGLVLEDGVWTVVTPTNQRLLDQCGVGTVHSSDQSVQYIAHTLNTPSQATVCILLSLLEALYYFDEIQIFDSTPEGLKQLTRPEFEKHCDEHQRSFKTLFRVFVHFKNKGWLMRSGINYGADFVLYDGHPSTVHAQYSVLVLEHQNHLSLHDLQASYRLCNQVSKGLLLVEVSDQIEVREIRRWISSREQH